MSKLKSTDQNENRVSKLKLAVVASFVFVASIMNTNAQAIAPGSYTIGIDYPTIDAAITALNTNSITGTGAVTIEIPAGYTETVTTAGGFSLTCSGDAGSPIIFRKNGAGLNPVVTSMTGGTGTPGSANQDGIWRMIGTDYITIDGVDLMDQNTANPMTMEFGYGFFKASVTDGCQNNTVKNCVITLSRNNNATGTAPATDGSRGIEVVNALTGAHTTAVITTTASGSNSNNVFSLNTIQNCNIGIAMIGFAATTPFAEADMNNDVTGNTIINYGGGTGATNPAAGIRTLNQYNVNVSNNVINSNNGGGVNHTSTLRGIYLNAATSANASILNNTVTVNSGATTSQLVGIENASGATAASNTINIIGNHVVNCTYTTATTSASFFGIYNNAATAANLNINNNVVSGLTLNTTNITGGLNFIYNNAAIGTALSISSNTIQNLTNLNTTGTIYNIYNSNNTGSYTIQANVVNNVARTATMSTGTMYGFYNNGSPGAGTVYFLNNSFSNLTGGGTGGTTFIGLQHTTSTSQTVVVTGNTITAINNGTNTTNGIQFSYGPAGSMISGNTISNMSGGAGINGIIMTGGTAPSGLVVTTNTVSGLITTGAFSAVGISHGTGVNTIIRKNRVFDITSNNATGTAFGIQVGALGSGSSINVQNNYVGDIKAPSTSNPVNAVVGINITATSTNAQIHVYYNTVYLTATSSGANFGTSGINHATSTTSTTAQLFLRNNIIINNSVQNGTGIVTAYRRSTATLNNYNNASNNNNFYVTPGPSTYLYYDGTNMFTTLAPYQTLVAPRDANSVSENTPFLSTSGPSATFLHVDPSLPSLTESGAVNIAGITDDYDNDIRQGNPGYSGTGSAPDIGADEYNQILPSCSTVTAATISAVSLSRCNGQTANMNATGFTTGSGITWQWQVASSMSGPFSNVVGGSGATTTSYTTAALTPNVYYYQFVTTCTLSSATATSNIISVTVSPVPTASATSNSPLCSGQTLNLTGSTDVGTNFTWTGPATFTVQNPSVTASASLSGTYTLIASIASCSSTPASVTVTITTTPSSLTVTPLTASVCAGSSVTLNATGGDIDKAMVFGTQANMNTASTGTIGYPAPYTAYYGGQRMQMLVLASELTAAGFVVNSPLMNIQFPVVSRGANWGASITSNQNFQVSVGTTTLTNITSFQSGLTNVVTPMNFTPMVGYNNTHTFASPFIWDGTSNVIVETTWSNNFAGGTGDLVTQYNSPTTFSSCVVYRADNVTAAATATAATPNFTYMVRPDFKLNGMGPAPYSWSPASSLSSSTSATTVATPTTSTDYTLTAMNGVCTSTAVSSITVSPIPTVSVSATPTTICAGGSASLTATGATTYSWSTGGTGSSINVTPSVTATYTVDGTNSCGTDTKTISVNVNPTPTVTAVTSASILCSGNSASLTANGASTYSWTGVGSGTTVVVSPTTTTTYTVEGIDSNGCMDTTTFTQVVSPCTGIQNILANSTGVSIYPNPSNGLITLIVTDVTKVMSLEVYDAIGKRVVNKEITMNETQINLSELANGIYSYRLVNANGFVSQGKLIKQ